MIAVAHAITLNQRLLVCFPINSGLLISTSIKIMTTGSRTPFSTCERIVTFTSGKCGHKTTPAPAAISSV